MGSITRSHTFAAGEKPTAVQWNVDINQLFTLVNGELDENNVDYTSADGIVCMQQTQTISGAKTFSAKTSFAGTYANPLVIGEGRLWYDATNNVFRVKDGSDPSNETDGNFVIMG